MDLRVKSGLLAAAIAIVVVGIIVLGKGGEEAQIIKQLNGLVETVEKSGDEGQLGGIGRAGRAAEFFTERPDVSIYSQNQQISDRKVLIGVIAQARRFAKSIDISIVSRTITLATNEKNADMIVRARAGVVFTDGTRESVDQRFAVTWDKVGGDWLISRVQVLIEE